MISLNRDHMTTFQVEQAFRTADVKREAHVEFRLFGPACAMTARGVGVSIGYPIVAADGKGKGVVIRPFEPPTSFEYAL